MRPKVTGERLAQFVLWIALCLVLVSLWRQHARESQSYRCVVYGSRPGVHDQVLCFEGDNGRMFRPERRFNKFTLENGEQ